VEGERESRKAREKEKVPIRRERKNVEKKRDAAGIALRRAVRKAEKRKVSLMKERYIRSSFSMDAISTFIVYKLNIFF